jgi:hypothetical protein
MYFRTLYFIFTEFIYGYFPVSQRQGQAEFQAELAFKAGFKP